MRGFIMLCDFAEEVNGKLYIMGGGWSRFMKVRPVIDMSIAAKLLVPWVETNRPHNLTVGLFTADGSPVTQGAERQVVQLGGQLEVGRPPGLKEGTEIDVPLAFRFEDLQLEAGRYRWELHVDSKPITDVTFDVVDV